MQFDEGVDDLIRRKAKALMRQRARALRNSIPHKALDDRSSKIVATAYEVLAGLQAKSVGLFWPMIDRHEVDLRELDAKLRADGARIAYPAIDPESRVMTFHFVADVGDLVERGLGFSEPPPGSPNAEAMDAILVPALQIDPRGYRLGYGAGFYDRTLPRFAPPAQTIGVVFDFQLAPEVPVTSGDVAVDRIVTDARVLVSERAPTA